MANFVETSLSNIRYPEMCPFCEVNTADSLINHGHTRGTGYFVVFAVYTSWNLKLPICTKCLNKIRNRRRITILVIIFSILFLFAALWYSPNSPSITLFRLSLLSFILCVYCFFSRYYELRKLKAVHVSDSTVTFKIASRKYALNFANMNGTQVLEKVFLFKIK